MRCKICGWVNPNDAEICEKCQQPLSLRESNLPTYENTEPANEEEKKENVVQEESRPEAPKRQKRHCPNCGYPVWNDMTICPQCKFPLQQALGNLEDQDNASGETDNSSDSSEKYQKKTFNPYVNAKREEEVKPGPKLTLSVQSVTKGGNSGKPQNKTFSGNEIRLNKQITETSDKDDTQVVITLENGQWYIEDTGSLKKTFVLAVRKMPVQEGDIIVINDRQCQIVKAEDGNNEDNNKK